MKNKILEALKIGDIKTLRFILAEVKTLDLSCSYGRPCLVLNELSLLVKVLKGNYHLTQLSLKYNQMGDQEGEIIAKLLRSNFTLTELNLSNNEIGYSGAKAIADVLKEDLTLLKLNLERNKLGVSGATAIAGALRSNHALLELNLAENRLSALGVMPIAGALQMNSTLESLSLRGNKIKDLGCDVIAAALIANTNLTRLDLGFNQIESEGCKIIAKILPLNTTLTQLDLGFNQICSLGCLAISMALKVNTALRQLDLRNNQLKNAGCAAIATALEHSPALVQLNLGENQIEDSGCVAMMEILEENSTLTYLDLGSNRISDLGGKAVARVLRVNPALTQLDLWDNQIGDAGCVAVAYALQYKSTLVQLDLGFNRIGAVGFVAMATALKSNAGLRKLNLGFNQEGALGCVAIADALQLNSTLLELDFSGNQVSILEGTTIAKALENNFTLTHLDLHYNQFGTQQVIDDIRKLLSRNNVIAEQEAEQQFLEIPMEIRSAQSYDRPSTNVIQVFKSNYSNRVETILKLEKLFTAIQSDNTAVASDLVTQIRKQELTIVNIEGKTALHLASEKDNEVIARSLLMKNLDLRNIQDRHKYTPLDLAEKHRSAKVIQVLNDFIGKGLEVCNEASYWYEYSKDKVSKILDLRMTSIKIEKIKVISPILWDGSVLGAKECSDRITSTLHDKEAVLVPINFFNKHWVGIAIAKNNNEINLNYMDSEQLKMPGLLKEIITTVLITEYPRHCVSIIEREVEKQRYNNCGPEVVENFMQHITSCRFSQEDAPLAHLLLLEDDLTIMIGDVC